MLIDWVERSIPAAKTGAVVRSSAVTLVSVFFMYSSLLGLCGCRCNRKAIRLRSRINHGAAMTWRLAMQALRHRVACATVEPLNRSDNIRNCVKEG